MLSLRAAAGLLGATGPDALAAIAAVCGCGGPPLELDTAARDALGLGCPVLGGAEPVVHVARGPGALRALLVQVPSNLVDGPPNLATDRVGDAESGGGPALRDVVQRVAARLSRRSPHLAWLCVASTGSATGSATGAARQLALATWSPDKQPPRTAALVVDRDAIVDSDAETLSALAAALGPDAGLTHARWLEVLSRESVTRRFYLALERAVVGMADGIVTTPRASLPRSEDRHALALLYASRLLFLAFLEAKGWLDRDRGFLSRTFEDCLRGTGSYHRHVLRPLFFGTLNTPPSRRAPRAQGFGRIPFLNGGLFGPTPLEYRTRGATFSDESVGALLGDVLCRYRFTAREDTSSWSEAAVDPEMLGKAFESLMAPAARRSTGAFYTPQSLVERVTHTALIEALASPASPAAAVGAVLTGEAIDTAVEAEIRARIGRLRVLDPACGSGAFLVFALETVARLAGCVGDVRGAGVLRRAVLTRSIFGVDVNPTAVWLCELRLWLAVVIETEESDPTRILPLPNLDRNVRVGDALTGGSFGDDAAAGEIPRAMRSRTGRLMARLRDRYARASGVHKRDALRTIERAERARAIDAVTREMAHVDRLRRDAASLARGRDLFGAPSNARAGQRLRRVELRARARALRVRLLALRSGGALPFSFAAHFADADAAGGFDAVVGNPPWVRPHAIPDADRRRYRRDFEVARDAAWAGPSTAPVTGPQFGAQIDLSAVFVERALTVARPGGVVALLVPTKLWRSLAGGGVRRVIAERANVIAIEDWAAREGTFDATVFPSLLVVRRKHRAGQGESPLPQEGGDARVAPTRADRGREDNFVKTSLAPEQ